MSVTENFKIRFEVETTKAVRIRAVIFKSMILTSGYQCFGGICYFQLRGGSQSVCMCRMIRIIEKFHVDLPPQRR
jgi:hypothetical protein